MLAFGRQVHDDVDGLVLEDRGHQSGVADVALDEAIATVGGDGLERRQIGGIGQRIEIDHAVCRVADQVAAHGRADEARAAGDEKIHGSSLMAIFVRFAGKQKA
jgi:hypothetical protein